MTDSQPTFLDALPPEDRELYSLNFHFAAYYPLEGVDRSEAYLNQRIPSSRHRTSSFKTSPFFKLVSTPLGRFEGIERHEG